VKSVFLGVGCEGLEPPTLTTAIYVDFLDLFLSIEVTGGATYFIYEPRLVFSIASLMFLNDLEIGTSAKSECKSIVARDGLIGGAAVLAVAFFFTLFFVTFRAAALLVGAFLFAFFFTALRTAAFLGADFFFATTMGSP
jgi:hypothetical protein